MDLFFRGIGIHGKTKLLEKSAVSFGVVRIIHRRVYFRGLIAFGKLKHQARFKAVEASTLKHYKLNFL